MQFVILNDQNTSKVARFLGMTLEEEMTMLSPMLYFHDYPCIELETTKKRLAQKRAAA